MYDFLLERGLAIRMEQRMPRGSRVFVASASGETLLQAAVPYVGGRCPSCMAHSIDPPWVWNEHGTLNQCPDCGQIGLGWCMSPVEPYTSSEQLVEWAHKVAASIKEERCRHLQAILSEAAGLLRAAGWDPNDLISKQAEVLLEGGERSPLYGYEIFDEYSLPLKSEWLSVSRYGGPLVGVLHPGFDDEYEWEVVTVD